MYQDKEMLASIKKVEAKRAENIKLDPRRMTAEEKEQLLATYQHSVSGAGHPFGSCTARGDGDVAQVLRLHRVGLQ